MKKYTVLMFGMSKYSDWVNTGVVNRNYHIVQGLIKDERIESIIFVDFLPFKFRTALKTIVKQHILGSTRGYGVFGNIFTQAWKVNSKVTVVSSVENILNPKKFKSSLEDILRKTKGNTELLVWGFNPMFVDYYNWFKNEKIVFDAVDDWRSHSSYKKYIPTLNKNYETIDSKSNIIFSVSKGLKDSFKNKNAYWIPNGVDCDHFETIEVTDLKINTPVIGFLGILQDRIDVALLDYLSTSRPEYNFVLAGPVWKNFNKEKLQKSNIHFIGPVNYSQIPKIYKAFDVGIVPYIVNEFVKSTNSMKFYEYLASGLPVVSTLSGGYEEFLDVISFAKNPEEFLNLLDNSLVSKSDIESQKRRDFVKKHHWNKRINQMLDLTLN